MAALQYLTDTNGKANAVVIPLDLWNSLFPKKECSDKKLSEAMENYCLNKAMDKACKTPLMSKEEALKFLET
ncbi:MAG: hypothetical protein JRJ44_02950 [Deltaproteobacteria bacterium]|nr:hypothetical protein [Deltaproteobacteria bacterium]